MMSFGMENSNIVVIQDNIYEILYIYKSEIYMLSDIKVRVDYLGTRVSSIVTKNCNLRSTKNALVLD